MKAVLGARIWRGGGGKVGGGVGTVLTSVENLAVTALELEPTSHLDSVYRVLFLVLHIGILKAPELKPRAQGHTAHKTPWGVRSDT